jgi:hypothetical protein
MLVGGGHQPSAYVTIYSSLLAIGQILEEPVLLLTLYDDDNRHFKEIRERRQKTVLLKSHRLDVLIHTSLNFWDSLSLVIGQILPETCSIGNIL